VDPLELVGPFWPGLSDRPLQVDVTVTVCQTVSGQM